jgi:hypothetical protein
MSGPRVGVALKIESGKFGDVLPLLERERMKSTGPPDGP